MRSGNVYTKQQRIAKLGKLMRVAASQVPLSVAVSCTRPRISMYPPVFPTNSSITRHGPSLLRLPAGPVRRPLKHYGRADSLCRPASLRRLRRQYHRPTFCSYLRAYPPGGGCSRQAGRFRALRGPSFCRISDGAARVSQVPGESLNLCPAHETPVAPPGHCHLS